MTHPSTIADEALLAECDVTRTRRSGPGGQHRNKVETAIVLHHRPTGLRVEGSASRSQAENLRHALGRLRTELALTVRRPAEEGPSELWLTRCRGGRVTVNSDHADFVAILAEALDQVAAAEFDVSAAAVKLGCSTTQLVRLLDQQPRALAWVNRERQARHQRPLRP